MIIGLTNLPCSGADTAGLILRERGFEWLSYSDILREELGKRGREVTRESMREMANELRQKEGTGTLSKRLLKKTIAGKNYVFGTIRNPGEVKELRKVENFFLVNVYAPPKVRFERMVARNREKDPATFENFMRLEEIELKDRVKEGLQVAECIKMADFKLMNDSTLEDLEKRIDNMLAQLNVKS